MNAVGAWSGCGGTWMLVSLSGVQVWSSASGHDCVSQSTMENHGAISSMKSWMFPANEPSAAPAGSFGSRNVYCMLLPEPGVDEKNWFIGSSWPV